MIAAIIQARVGSTRLPGKVLKEIGGKPLLAHVIERVKRSHVDVVLVATTEKLEDERVVEIARSCGVSFFRGSESDVLDRYYHSAQSVGATTIVRITGDCPLHDPNIIDLVIERFKDRGVDYTCTPRNYPEGLDTEVFSFSALEISHTEARLPSEREHVTQYIRNHAEKFQIDEAWFAGSEDHSTMHWSVDTEEDFRFVEAVYAALGHGEDIFHTRDILKLLQERPELLEINKGGTGFEGLEKSLREDAAWRENNV